MKKIITILFVLPLLLIAQIPQTMNYQGLLQDDNGDPVADGNYTVIFTIYDAATTGNSLWTETRTITTKGGFFNLTLGENTPLNISTDAQLWLNVNVEGTDLTPRTQLAGNLSSISTKSIENTTVAGNSIVEAINSSTGGVNTDKLADGTVNNTELQYLNDVTSNIQTQLNGKQATLPDQSGNANKFLSTDGSTLSWQDAGSGGGSSNTASTLTVPSDVTVNSTSYTDITGISETLDANSTYLLKGIIETEKLGSSCVVDIKLDYTGTTNLNMFKIETESSDANGYKGSYNGITSSIPMIHQIEGTIDTSTSGTLQMKMRKTASNKADVNITTNTKIILIKIR